MDINLKVEVKHFIKTLILSQLFILLFVLCSGCSSGFISSQIAEEEITDVTFLYQTSDAEVSLTLRRDHPAFSYLLDYLDSPFEKLSLPSDQYAVDPLVLIISTGQKSQEFFIITLQTEDPYHPMVCLKINDTLYQIKDEGKKLCELTDLRTMEGELIFWGKNNHPLYTLFRLLSFNDSFPGYTHLIEKTGTREEWEKVYALHNHNPLLTFRKAAEASDLIISGTVVDIRPPSQKIPFNPQPYAPSLTVKVDAVFKGSVGSDLIFIETNPVSLFDHPEISLTDADIDLDHQYLFCLSKSDTVQQSSAEVYSLYYEAGGLYLLMADDSLFPYFHVAPELESLYPRSLDEVNEFIE